MKVVILAGGLGTRISEESHLRPKPMIEIGGMPILWHIMKSYAHHGLTDFVIACGYRGYMIKEFFMNYALHRADVTVNTRSGGVVLHRQESEDWNVSLVDTGEGTQTGGRLKRLADYLDSTFCLTYGDGLTSADLSREIEQHRSSNVEATLLAVRPEGRYGVLDLSGDVVTSFNEKIESLQTWVSGGFFVCEPEVLSLIESDETAWEREPLQRLAESGNLGAWRHEGFWKAMDTLRDKEELESLWHAGRAPWRCWE